MIHRRRRPGAHSIEGLFSNLARVLAADVDLIEFHCGRWRDVARDARKLRAIDADVYHVTGDVHYIVPWLPRGRVVLTVHDIRSWSDRLTGWRRWVYWLLWIQLPCRAAEVVAISRFTRDQLASAGVAAARVGIIPNAVAPAFRPRPRHPRSERGVVVVVGTGDNKNLARIVDAAKGLPLSLLIVGLLSEAQRSLLAASGVAFETRHELTEPQMVDCYARGDMVCFPSTFEGFGMPIIEAQAVGRPVITSRREPMISVAGGAALLVDPDDTLEIRAALQRLLGDDALCEQLVALGRRNAAAHEIASVAAMYRELYERVSSRASAPRRSGR